MSEGNYAEKAVEVTYIDDCDYFNYDDGYDGGQLAFPTKENNEEYLDDLQNQSTLSPREHRRALLLTSNYHWRLVVDTWNVNYTDMP